MAYIELSPLFANGNASSVLSSLYRTVGTVNVNDATSPLIQGFSTSGTSTCTTVRLTVFSGVRPAVPPLSVSTPSGATLLATFPVGNVLGSGLSQHDDNFFVVRTSYVAAAASGLATFFILAAQFSNNITAVPTYSNNNAAHCITGDIGTVGSGADLEIANTSIVAGEQVRILNLRFRIPRIFGA